MLPPNQNLSLLAKMKEDTGKSMKMHCMFCGMPKGTEATSNSEKQARSLSNYQVILV